MDEEYRINEDAVDSLKAKCDAIQARNAARKRAIGANVDLECILANIHQLKAYIMMMSNTAGISSDLADDISLLLENTTLLINDGIEGEEKKHGN